MRTAELKLINNYIAKNNPKLELNGMFLDKDNKKLVATDTRALITYECEDLIADGILHKEAVELALKSVVGKNEKDVVFHSRDGKMYYFGATPVLDIQTSRTESKDSKCGVIIGMTSIIGTYPSYERILVDTSGDDVIRVDTNHTNIFRDISKRDVIIDYNLLKPLIDYMKTRDCTATVYIVDKSSPIAIKCNLITLVIMPLPTNN